MSQPHHTVVAIGGTVKLNTLAGLVCLTILDTAHGGATVTHTVALSPVAASVLTAHLLELTSTAIRMRSEMDAAQDDTMGGTV